MDRSVYVRMDAQETEHWWFRARRDIIRTVIGRIIRLPENARILEAGCGTGGNLEMLMKFGKVDAFEFDETARQVAEQKSGLPIPFGALPDQIPAGDTSYDLIGLYDVLEHVEDDVGSLHALGSKLSDDGVLMVTVPAFQWLWSKHDVSHHHFKRYTRRSLAKYADQAGLDVVSSHYFNGFLLPVAIAMRSLKKIIGSEAPDDVMPSPAANRLLYKLFSFERHLIGRLPFPAGLSVMILLKKRKHG